MNRRITHALLRVSAYVTIAGTLALGAVALRAESAIPTPHRFSAASGVESATRRTIRELDIALRQPDVPRRGRNRFVVTVRNAAGDPVRDADVSLILYNRGIPGPKGFFQFPTQTRVQLVPGELAGTYEGVGAFSASGSWDATIRVQQRGDQRGRRSAKLWIRR